MDDRQSDPVFRNLPAAGWSGQRGCRQEVLDLGLRKFSSPALRRLVVAMKAAGQENVSIADGVRFVAEHAIARLSETTLRSYVPVWHNFERYARARGVEALAEVTSDLVIDFKAAKRRPTEVVAANTQRRRQSAVSFMFDRLREHGVVVTNPCHGMDTGYQRPPGPRPLTDGEIEACRWAAHAAIASDRYPLVLALAEIGMSTASIGFTDWRRIDLGTGRVEVPACRKTFQRTLSLTPWGLQIVSAHAAEHVPEPSSWVTVTSAKDYDSRRSSVGAVLTDILGRASLRGLPRVEPRSITAWAARSAYDVTGRIEDAAYVIGTESFDSAAELIELDVKAMFVDRHGTA